MDTMEYGAARAALLIAKDVAARVPELVKVSGMVSEVSMGIEPKFMLGLLMLMPDEPVPESELEKLAVASPV